MKAMNWIDRVGNAMDIAAKADTDRMTWDKDYQSNLIHTLETGDPVECLHAERLPAFPFAMRRMMAFLDMNKSHEWATHEHDMRNASKTCDLCPDYDACLKADQPLVHVCPNQERFKQMAEA